MQRLTASAALRGLTSSTSSSSSSRRGLSVLVLADHDNKALQPATLAAVTAAKKLNAGKVTVLVAGSQATPVAEQAAKVQGVDAVVHAKDAALDHASPENLAALVAQMHKASALTHVVGVASGDGKNCLPRVGAALDVQPISDVISVVSADTFVRPTYAGNALAKVQSTDKVKVLTVRPSAFPKAAATGGNAVVSAAPALAAPVANAAKWVEDKVVKSERPELTAATKIVAGGRGLKSGDNFKIIYALADKLGAAVGASRAAVDAGYQPNELQIGQTGKVVAPELYIGAGISGAVQHLAGMADSKVIVVINNDPEAPFFQIADYGLVADLFKAVPELTQKV